MAKLFSPLDVGALVLSHRLVSPGLVQFHLTKSSRNSRRFDYMDTATSQGLIISEPCFVSIEGAGNAHYSLLHSDGVNEWREVTDAVHRRGGLIIAQLSHMGRIAHSSITQRQPCGPSMLPARCLVRRIDGVEVTAELPLALTQAQIDSIIVDYRNSAIAAVSAGFDGVELNSADGHLPNQFLSDNCNCRADQYGGSISNRILFLSEVLDVLIKVCGSHRVGVRISPFSSYNDAADSSPIELYTAVLHELHDHDIAYAHFVRSDINGKVIGHEAFADPDAAQAFRSAYSGVFIVSGEFTRTLAVSLVQSRWADAIGFGKSFLADPYISKRLAKD